MSDGKTYWKAAANAFRDRRLLTFAALIIALRVAVKFLKIPLGAGLYFSFDCYVNALGSLVYGPIVALAVGAVSDTLGCLIAPTGPYFFPFMLVEMGSSFLFSIFFWRKPLSVPRAIAAKFTVNFVCNIVLTSLFYKWSLYVFYGVEKAEAYALINGVRIAKSLVLFPVEALLIALLFKALLPFLKRERLLPADTTLTLSRRHYVLIAGLLLLSVGLVLFYIYFLKDFLTAHNFKLL